ncbi:hypothetical protein HKX48_008088 [Thoreauomyces humboldtii]|nr:hypothetical protein HKX48_008088 [Thoreauomyces humboldtii]
MSLFDQFESEGVGSASTFPIGGQRPSDQQKPPLILEQGYVSTRIQQTPALAIFSLDRVQFPFPVVNLVSLAVSSNTLVLVADGGGTPAPKAGQKQRILRIDLGKSDAIDGQ